MTTVMYGGAPPVLDPRGPLPRDVDTATSDRLAAYESWLKQPPVASPPGTRINNIQHLLSDDDVRRISGAPPHATVEHRDGHVIVSWAEGTAST
jgi:hypothetical protein